MSALVFEPVDGVLWFQCPKCRTAVHVVEVQLEPVVQGNGLFVKYWFLQVGGRCKACGWEGRRAAGKVRQE